jgi:hypothetical protein
VTAQTPAATPAVGQQTVNGAACAGTSTSCGSPAGGAGVGPSGVGATVGAVVDTLGQSVSGGACASVTLNRPAGCSGSSTPNPPTPTAPGPDGAPGSGGSAGTTSNPGSNPGGSAVASENAGQTAGTPTDVLGAAPKLEAVPDGSGASRAGRGQLPFTGSGLLVIALAGAVVTAAGLACRRWAPVGAEA